MDRAAGICENAGMIILCGDGEGAMLARYGAYLLNSAGKAAFSAENGSALSCPDLERGNVLLVLSASGDDSEKVRRESKTSVIFGQMSYRAVLRLPDMMQIS